MAENANTHSGLAENEGWSRDRYLLELCELELGGRHARLSAASRLSQEKTATTFDKTCLDLHVAQRWEALKGGEFLHRRENVLAFVFAPQTKPDAEIMIRDANGTIKFRSDP